MGVTGCWLAVQHGPSCCTFLDYLNRVAGTDGVGVLYRTGMLQKGSHKSFVVCCFNLAAADTYVPPDKAQGLVCPAGNVCNVQVPSQVISDPYSRAFGTGDILQMMAMWTVRASYFLSCAASSAGLNTSGDERTSSIFPPRWQVF